MCSSLPLGSPRNAQSPSYVLSLEYQRKQLPVITGIRIATIRIASTVIGRIKLSTTLNAMRFKGSSVRAQVPDLVLSFCEAVWLLYIIHRNCSVVYLGDLVYPVFGATVLSFIIVSVYCVFIVAN